MSFVLLGILNSQVSGAAFDSSFDLLDSEVLASNTLEVSFTNLNTLYAADYQHLQLRVSQQSAVGANQDDVRIQFNGDSGSNVAYHQMYGYDANASATSARFQSGMRLFGNGDASDNNAYGPMIIDILNPFETGRTRTVQYTTGQLNRNWVMFGSAFYNSTNVLNSLTFYTNSGNNFRSRSRFSLYGWNKV